MNLYYTNQAIIDPATLEETSNTVLSGLPYRTDICVFDALEASACPWHWHNDVEIFYIQTGTLLYHTPKHAVYFEAGDVGFVNANVLHMTESVGETPVFQQEHIFLPRMLASPVSSAVETRYIEPVIKNHAAELMRLPADTEAAEAMRALLDKAFDAYIQQSPGYEFRLYYYISEMWLLLLEHMPRMTSVPADLDMTRVKAMVCYIEENYASQISLDDIASAAHIGKGEAARCFQRTLHMTAFTFLIGYRIDRAKDRLRHSSDSITKICTDSGFSSMSYFGKVFREKTGMTPSQYQRQAKGSTGQMASPQRQQRGDR